MTFDAETFMTLEMTETEFGVIKTFADFLNEYAESVDDSNSRLVDIVDSFTYKNREDVYEGLHKMNVDLVVRGK